MNDNITHEIPPSSEVPKDERHSTFNELVRFFISHRNAAHLLMLSMIIFGFLGLRELNTQFFPEIEIEVVGVTIVWPGASAEDVDVNIVEPLQAQLRFLAGVDELESRSRFGLATFNINYKRGFDMSQATNDVEAAISQITTLPKDIERPIVRQYVNYDPVGNILLSGKFPERALKSYALKLRDGLLDAGVDKVDVVGARDEEIWVEVRIDQIRRYDLTINQIASAIRSSSLDMPGGLVRAETEKQIRATGLKKTAEEIGQIEIRALTSGERVLVKDVARVSENFNSDQSTGWSDGKRAVQLKVFRSETSDSLDTLNILREFASEAETKLPQGMELKVYDTLADKIAQRLGLLLRNGLGGMVLVLITLFLFLNARIAFWVALGIPISIMATLGFMWPLDRTLNMLSMFTFIMTLGIIVDDAIVVGEHSATVFKRGTTPEYAAERGAIRMSKPIFAAGLTTLAAFFPVLTLDNIFGDLVRPIPIIVFAVLAASLIECFFILPSHLKHALTQPEKPPTGFRKRFLDKFEEFRHGRFKQLTIYAYQNRYTTLSIAVACFIIAISLFAGGRLQFRFFPAPEMERIAATIIFHSGTPREITKKGMEAVELALHETDKQLRNGNKSLINEHFSRLGSIGYSSGNHLAYIETELIASELRTVRTKEFIKKWKENFPPMAGIRYTTVEELGDGPGASPIELRLQGDSLINLKKASGEVVEDLKLFPSVIFPWDNLFFGKQEILIEVNANGAALGFTNQIVGQQLRNAYEGAIARRFARGDNEVTIRVMLPRDFGKPQSLDNFFLAVPGSSPIRYVPFAQVVDVSEKPGFASIQRAGGAREVVIRAGFADNSGNPADVIREYSKTKLPAILEKYDVQQVVRGEQEDMNESFLQLLIGLFIALGLIYIILALVFSSYSKPLVIMSVIPFGMIGAILGHYVQGYEFNFLSMIALLGLSGILVNNSIILISRIDERISSGEDFEDSVINGVNDRLRAVVLTSMTTVLGLTPMLFETSTQAQFLLPMVITMAWGLASSAFLVLLLVPAVLGIQCDISNYFQQRKQRRALAE